jgi:hypothetical protein
MAHTTLRDAYVPSRRVRIASDVAGICVAGLLLGHLGSAVTWWGRSDLFDLASTSLQTVKLGTGYFFGPVLILIALPLVLGRRRQVAVKRWFKERVALAVALWLAGLVILVTKVSGLDGYTIEAGTYITGTFLIVGLVATIAMWPAGLRVVKIDRNGSIKGPPQVPSGTAAA